MSDRIPPFVTRVTANNPGPMTERGTNAYVFGDDELCAIVDPGPDDDTQLGALEEAVRGRTVEAVLLTHRHRDHDGLVSRAYGRFGAGLFASAAPIRSDRHSRDASELRVDRVLADGDRFRVGGRDVEAVATPGHTSDHLCFALADAGLLFSGDHVMGWSTTVVIPPDGSMRAYRASLRKLLGRSEALYLPGHGDPIERPHRLARSHLAHRRQREEMILRELRAGPRTVGDLVERLYPDLDGTLAGAAALSVKAHLIELFEDGAIAGPDPAIADGPFALCE